MSAKIQVLTEENERSLQSIRESLKKTFVERDSIIDCLLVAILSKKNIFMLGPPGTAKSALANAVSKSIGGNYFYALMGKTTAPEELFGPVSIEGIKNSRYERNTDGMLPEAHIACLDECFKASSAVLNTTLTIMNERTFRNGTTIMKTPTITVIGASNEVPEEENLTALYDRFTLKVKVDYIQQASALEALLLNGGVDGASIPSINLECLQEEQDKVKKVVFPNSMVKLVLEVKRALEEEGMEVSDRKLLQAMDVIRAFAHLNGRSEVEESDLEILAHVVWETEDQIKNVKRIITKVCNPIAEKVTQINDAVREVFTDLDNKKIKPGEAINKVKSCIEKLTEISKNHQDNPKVRAALEESNKLQKQIIESYLFAPTKK